MPIPAYPLFTVSSGVVERGITVDTFRLTSASKDIPAIVVGESGPGRRRDIVSVELPDNLLWQWRREGALKIFAGSLGKTKSQRWRVFAQEKNAETTEDEVLCVFRTKYGVRGGNSHTGDYLGWGCSSRGCVARGDGEVPDRCPECGMMSNNHEDEGPACVFADFPGRVLVRGVCADDDAGRKASGEQLVAAMPRGVVFRTHYTDNLHGGPDSHYYVWNGMELLSATQEERDAGDPF